MFVSSKTTIGFITHLLVLERIVAAFLDFFTVFESYHENLLVSYNEIIGCKLAIAGLKEAEKRTQSIFTPRLLPV